MSKTIGILGGMSPESTTAYYEHITRRYTELYGDYGYPQVAIWSVDFQQIVDWQHAGRWDLIGEKLAQGMQRLVAAGAELGVIATNTMHYVYDAIQAAVDIPILNIVDVTAQAILQRGLSSVGLLGTDFTMSQPFYRERLSEHGLMVLTPNQKDRALVNRIIYEELTVGKLLDESRRAYLQIIQRLQAQGAQGVILGCTEIPLLIQQKDCQIPVFDTTSIHAESALQYALE